jgi:hypothetical protein
LPHVDVQPAWRCDLTAPAMTSTTDRDRTTILFHRFNYLLRRRRRNHHADGNRIELGYVVDQIRRRLTLNRRANDTPDDYDGRHCEDDDDRLD